MARSQTGTGRRAVRRWWRLPTLVVGFLALVLAGCGADSTAPASTTATTSRTSAVGTPTTGALGSTATLASSLVFGSGSECPHEPYCLPGLESTYGLMFKSFVVTDSGGQKTVDA